MRTDIVYAMTDEGEKLAVIDVTNPAFAVSATDEELVAMAEQYILEAGRQQRDSCGASRGPAKLEAWPWAYGGLGDVCGRDDHLPIEAWSGEFGGGLQPDRPKDRRFVSRVYSPTSFAGHGSIDGGRPSRCGKG